MRIIQSIKREGFIGAGRRYWRRAQMEYHRAVGSRSVRTAYGVPMISNWDDMTFELCFAGSYGRVLSSLLELRREPFVFLDIGANQGVYSLIAARNPACLKVYAFEPVAATHALLVGNIELNAAASQITPLRFGISNTDGTATILTSAGHSGVASLQGHLPGGKPEEIELRTADSLAPLILPSDVPLVVKVDVEGHETVVLEQLAGSGLSERVVALFYEVDERWCDPDELARIVAGMGLSTTQKVGTGLHYDVLAKR
jgi:FkbM family methyltransferase